MIMLSALTTDVKQSTRHCVYLGSKESLVIDVMDFQLLSKHCIIM